MDAFSDEPYKGNAAAVVFEAAEVCSIRSSVVDCEASNMTYTARVMGNAPGIHA